ncbi:MAG TPA: EamA family transporter [Pirellulales bacterium]|nr:EamA family transporter [Pirellulales bacterium]
MFDWLWLCIGIRIVANPVSNVYQKLLTRDGANSLVVVCVTHSLLSMACLPAVPWISLMHRTEFWSNMAVGALLNVAGNALLVQAMQLSDLSVLGPINAYKSVVSLLPAIVLLGEVPAPAALAGIALIVAGSYGLADRAEAGVVGWTGLWRDRGVQCRLAALVFNAVEAVFLKRALLISSPLPTFVVWSVLGFVASWPVVALLLDRSELRRQASLVRTGLAYYLSLCVTTGLMQLCTIVVLGGLQVGYVLALFQVSAIISVLLGRQVFGERHFIKRLIGSAVMAAGAALIVIYR